MTFFEKHGVDEFLFENGIAAVKIESPFGGDYGRGKVYYARQTYGGYDLYTTSGKRYAHAASGSGDAARIVNSIYDGIEGEN